jgi:hypothetical protein
VDGRHGAAVLDLGPRTKKGVYGGLKVRSIAGDKGQIVDLRSGGYKGVPSFNRVT